VNDAAHPSTTRKPHLPALTGLRALLALGILFFHFTPPHVQLIAPIIDTAYAFVAVFFLLSGYVLAYNYADRAAPLNKRNFWQARFARLYPVYLLALILSLPMLQAEWFARSRSDFIAGLILTPLLLQGWSPTLATFWNTVAWALSAELLLYLSFPWLIRLPWPKSTTRLVELLLAIWIIGLLPHTFYLLLNPDHLTVPANRYSYGYWLRWIKFSPIIYAATFVIGVGLGKLQLALTLTTRQRSLFALTALLALAAFYLAATAYVPYVLLHGGVMTPLFALLILGLSGRNFLSSLFSLRPLTILGEASYCLFLLHFNFLNLLHLHHVSDRLHLVAYDPWISYAATILLAIAALYLVEIPARKALLPRRIVLHSIHQTNEDPR
jgi:peptidoglycan/LPS O-acetylase OafA/YrhL